jgi:hypothetical protein
MTHDDRTADVRKPPQRQQEHGTTEPEGKARVALNAIKHGLLSRESLVKGESRAAAGGLTWRRTTLSKPPAPSRPFTVADAHALADRLE